MQKIPLKIFIQNNKPCAFYVTLNGVEHFTCDFYKHLGEDQIDLRTSGITRLNDKTTRSLMEDITTEIVVWKDPYSRIIDTQAEIVWDEAKTWGISTVTLLLAPGTLN